MRRTRLTQESRQRGYFVVLEGVDGSGVSTQASLLYQHITALGRKAQLTKEPTTGPIGSLVRLALTGRLIYPPVVEHGSGVPKVIREGRPLDDELLTLLYAADRLDHLSVKIEPALTRGIDIVSDRYILSTLAFQSLSADTEWVLEVNSRARRPDLSIFLDVPPDVSIRRIASRGAPLELYEHEDKIRRVRENYMRFIPLVREIGWTVAIVDGSGTAEEVHTHIRGAYTKALKDWLTCV